MNYFKTLNKKYGLCCSWCGKRSKKQKLNPITKRNICLTCYDHLMNKRGN